MGSNKQLVVSEGLVYMRGNVGVNAALYRPIHTSGKLPAVVFCTGGWGSPIGEYEFLTKPLAEAGFVVLTTAYSGPSLMNDDADAMSAIDFLVGKPYVDPNKIGIAGHSRGGMCSLRTSAQDSRVKCVAAIEPPIDLAQLHGAFKDLSPDLYQYVNMGAPAPETPEMIERLGQFSALRFADRIKVPVYFIAGTFDLFAPPQQSRMMQEALVKAGNQNVVFDIIPQIGHFFEYRYFGYQHDLIASLVQNWFVEKLGS